MFLRIRIVLISRLNSLTSNFGFSFVNSLRSGAGILPQDIETRLWAGRCGVRIWGMATDLSPDRTDWLWCPRPAMGTEGKATGKRS
jgi:hypothetical protein